MLARTIALTVLSLAALTNAQVSIEPIPQLTQCEDVTITWSGGSAPYTVYIYPEFYLDEISYLERISVESSTSTTWTVNVPATTRIRFNVRDSTNPGFEDSEFTSPSAVGSGHDNSCLTDGPLGTAPIVVPTGTGIPTPSIPPPPSLSDPFGSITSASGSASRSRSASVSVSSSSAASASSSSASASATETSNAASHLMRDSIVGSVYGVAVGAGAVALGLGGGFARLII